MPNKNTTEQAPKARKTAEDYAREAAADNPATRSTPEKPRPVSITSTDEARAAAGLKRFEVEEELPTGRRIVHRVLAADTSSALFAVFGDDEAHVMRVDEQRPA
jgi:hypothetical protein